MAVTSAREIFQKHMPAKLASTPDLAKKINATYKFVITGAETGTWVVDLTQGGGTIKEGEGEAKCTITIAATDLIDIINGKLNGQMAFMSGKLKVAGDMTLALKLNALLS